MKVKFTTHVFIRKICFRLNYNFLLSRAFDNTYILVAAQSNNYLSKTKSHLGDFVQISQWSDQDTFVTAQPEHFQTDESLTKIHRF